MHSLSGDDFEDLVADLLRNSGYKNVITVGGSGDRGVDIVCKLSEGGSEKRVALQCKRWCANVGSTAIQRLHSYGIIENQDILMCITTSGFTSEGDSVSRHTGVRMVDSEKLLLWLDRVYPGKYFL